MRLVCVRRMAFLSLANVSNLFFLQPIKMKMLVRLLLPTRVSRAPIIPLVTAILVLWIAI